MERNAIAAGASSAAKDLRQVNIRHRETEIRRWSRRTETLERHIRTIMCITLGIYRC